MIIKDKTNDVAEGCMQFIKSLTYNHYANEIEVLERVAELCAQRVGMLKASDPERNK
tara:strand:- start:98 stop:268 length:171 start_codon:yes stop_codon:yes gene_type:complete